jgi:hypothetical protein
MCFDCDAYIAYPIPINYVVGLLYRLWCKLRRGTFDETTKQRVAAAYDEGYKAAMSCRAAGFRPVGVGTHIEQIAARLTLLEKLAEELKEVMMTGVVRKAQEVVDEPGDNSKEWH